MDDYVITRFHHGVAFFKDGTTSYVGEKKSVAVFTIDKDHFSMIELLYYTKELGYLSVEGFYYKKLESKFLRVESDAHILDIVRHLKNTDSLNLYVLHGNTDHVSGKELNGETENLENINVEEDEGFSKANVRIDVDIVDEAERDAEEHLNEVELDVESSYDSQEDGIPEEDDSEVDEELRSIKEEKRSRKAESKEQKKVTPVNNEIFLREAEIDKGFEDIGRNKSARYTRRLGGNEQFIDSSEADSNDNKDELDPEAVSGVDLPARRMSTNLRYDNDDYQVSIFEIGMIFESVEDFRKAVAKYVVENKVKLKLRPNEQKRVRARCKDERCKWLLYGVLDTDSGDFMVKNYHPVHKCITSNGR